METMFWVWLGVILSTAVLEIITTDLISIWFTFGAILPLILSLTTEMSSAWQIVIFLLLSSLLLACLRKITFKFLFKNSDTKTNLDAMVGQKFRLIERTDFETVGRVKVKDVEWGVVGENQATIEKGKTVEVVKIKGNKLVVKEVEEEKTQEDKKAKKENKK